MAEKPSAPVEKVEKQKQPTDKEVLAAVHHVFSIFAENEELKSQMAKLNKDFLKAKLKDEQVLLSHVMAQKDDQIEKNFAAMKAFVQNTFGDGKVLHKKLGLLEGKVARAMGFSGAHEMIEKLTYNDEGIDQTAYEEYFADNERGKFFMNGVGDKQKSAPNDLAMDVWRFYAMKEKYKGLKSKKQVKDGKKDGDDTVKSASTRLDHFEAALV